MEMRVNNLHPNELVVFSYYEQLHCTCKIL